MQNQLKGLVLLSGLPGSPVYLQGVEELSEAAPGALVLRCPHWEQGLGPGLAEHGRGSVHALRVKVEHGVGARGAQEVHGRVGLDHLPHRAPERTAQSGLEDIPMTGHHNVITSAVNISYNANIISVLNYNFVNIYVYFSYCIAIYIFT